MGTRPALVEAVEASREGLEQLLRQLVAFRTESQAKEAQHFPEEACRCIAYVRDFLVGLGLEIEGWDSAGPGASGNVMLLTSTWSQSNSSSMRSSTG